MQDTIIWGSEWRITEQVSRYHGCVGRPLGFFCLPLSPLKLTRPEQQQMDGSLVGTLCGVVYVSLPVFVQVRKDEQTSVKLMYVRMYVYVRMFVHLKGA